MGHVKDLPKNFLAIEIPPAAPATPASAEPTAGKPAEGTPPAPSAALSPEQAEKLRKMSNDLRWLVMEGYVTEFSDGKLFAPLPMAPPAAKKAEAGEEEHDPVDFPEAPTPAAVEAKPAGTAVEAAPTESAADTPVHAPEAAPASAEPPADDQPAAEPKPEPQA